jgi:hypothetical protein
VTLAAQARSSLGQPLTLRWTVERRPSGSVAEPAPADAATARFTFDRGGEWLLRLTATDRAGATASCTTRLSAEPVIELLCPNDVSNYEGATVRLEAVLRSTLGRAVTARWALLARPPGSLTSLTPGVGTFSTLLLDHLGDWRVQLTATDSAGLMASCTANVHADPDVLVTCPADRRSSPFLTLPLVGEAQSRTGLPLTYRWEVVEAPLTSTAVVTGATSRVASFTFDVAGDWTWRFTATNARGNSASCTTRARAASDEAVRVEIVWNTDRACVGCGARGEGQDIDLHLADVARAGGRWASGAGDADCYFANCICGSPGMFCAMERLDWPPMGSVNNPQLDIDHISDLPGPENINVRLASPGTQFDVGVHFFSAHAASPFTTVVARVYCGGRVVFESEGVRLEEGPSTDHNLWRVGRITVTDGGCTFAPCGAPGALGPCIRSQGAW